MIHPPILVCPFEPPGMPGRQSGLLRNDERQCREPIENAADVVQRVLPFDVERLGDSPCDVFGTARRFEFTPDQAGGRVQLMDPIGIDIQQHELASDFVNEETVNSSIPTFHEVIVFRQRFPWQANSTARGFAASRHVLI